jgi:DNA-binding transcriptional ArsR family regulator
MRSEDPQACDLGTGIELWRIFHWTTRGFLMSSFGEAVKQRALRVRPTPAIEKHISKAFGHYLRIQILWILNERVASASELAEELSAPLNRISGHIKVLREAECIEVVDQVVVGNAVQKFYRATARVFFDDTEWRAIPPTVKEGLRITLLQNLVDDAIEAVEHELYDCRDGSHMSWTPMVIDERGVEELAKLLDEALRKALAIQRRAAKRLCEADEEGIGYSVSILGYPSIAGIKKVNPAKARGVASDARATGIPRGKAAGKDAKTTRRGKVANKASGAAQKRQKRQKRQGRKSDS